MRRLLIVFICLLMLCCAVKAQVPDRARKFFEQAMRYELARKHGEARQQMERAIMDYPAYTEAYSILGTWYFKDHRFEKSAETFGRAYYRSPRGAALFAFPYAKSLVYSGKATEALNIINNIPSKGKEWKALREQAQFVQQHQKHAWQDTVFNMGPGINTSDAETFPWISSDEQKIYLTRRMNNTDEDFYMAEMDTCGEWYSARNLGSPPNTPNQEAAQMISADGHYLFFMECENRSPNGWALGGCDLYMSYTADSVWSAAQSFGATINTPAFEGMPCLSPDNRELYFVSDRAGGFGGKDIWVSRFEEGLWRQPRNLGPNVNTPGDETSPFLHIDNNTLYFSGNGHPGFGGSDLYMSQKITDSTWTRPRNMGLPINSAADENSLCISVDGRNLYFSSDRDSVAGNFDLYKMKLPQRLQPVPVNIVKGFVYDSLNKSRLNYASIFIKDIHTGEQLYHFNSNRGDGSYMITLIAGKKYLWHTDRHSFRDGDDTLDLTEQSLKEPFIYNIPLLPADYREPVNDSLVLRIHFPINGSDLTDTDRVRIQTALAPWIYDRAGLVILVNSYTDNSGTPILNEELSYMRAGLVAREVQTLGFDETSISAKGWGEADPLAPNDTEEGKNQNRRVEIIIRR